MPSSQHRPSKSDAEGGVSQQDCGHEPKSESYPKPYQAEAENAALVHFKITSDLFPRSIEPRRIIRKVERLAPIALSYTQPDRLAVRLMRRPAKTELEFVILAACMLVPAGYWMVRTMIAIIAG